jgi:hypothetical protein
MLIIGGLAVIGYARPADTGEHYAFFVNLDKNTEHPKGCLVRQPQGVGDLLDCTITAPPEASGYISHIEYSCQAGPPRSDNSCNWVHECPAQGQAFCQDHPYAIEPHDLELAKARTVNWFGNTNDGNHAILHFDVYMRDGNKTKK